MTFPRQVPGIPLRSDFHELPHDVVYADADGVPLRYDHYRPLRVTAARPAVVFVHGGGWMRGDPSQAAGNALHFARRGIATVSISYRLAPAHRFPGAARRRAPRPALRARARRASSASIPSASRSSGLSAGAHLAMLAHLARDMPELAPDLPAELRDVSEDGALRDRALRPVRPRPAAAPDVVDRRELLGARARTIRRGCDSPRPSRTRRARRRPMLLIHGTADQLVSHRGVGAHARGAARTPGSRASCCCSTARRTPSRSTGAARRTSAPTSRWTPSSIATCARRAERWRPAATARPAALFARAERVVPGGIYGHQSPRMLVPGAYPYFFARGEGARVWDVDGNEYLDLMCSYGPDRPRPQPPARRRGGAPAGGGGALLQRSGRACGSSWPSGSSSLTPVGRLGGLREERLRRLHLGDAGRARRHRAARRCWWPRARTTARIAWCSPDARRARRPRTARTSSRFRYNDLAERRRRAATRTTATWPRIIVTPVPPRRLPRPGDGRARASWPGLRARCDRLGAVLILDDVRAGFRLHLGGSGEAVGVQPDLTCYCKALGNGYPISAALGRDALRDAAAQRLLHRLLLDERRADGGRARLPRRARGERRHRATWRGSARALRARHRAPGRRARPRGPLQRATGDPVHDLRRRRGLASSAAACSRPPCAARGVYLHPHHNWFLSAALGEADVARVLEVTDGAFAEVARRET